ncbi:MAG: hypothetical protein ACHQII_03480 [Bacteroidia bacterium]
MRRANFIVGFNNWGKAAILFELFGKERYAYHLTHHMVGITHQAGFMVQALSNDFVGQNIEAEIERRVHETSHLNPAPDLFSALCPSLETHSKMNSHNNFLTILSNPVFKEFDEFNFFLLLNKWDHHAQLNTTNIINTYNKLHPNSNFYIIDDSHAKQEDRVNQKLQQIQKVLRKKYQTENEPILNYSRLQVV